MSRDIHVFNKLEQLKFICSNDEDRAEACPYWDAPYKENLDLEQTFEMTVPGDNPDAATIEKGDLLGFFDDNGDYQLFGIYDIEDDHGESGTDRKLKAEHVFFEMADDEIIDKRPRDTTADVALGDALAPTRFLVGIVADLGIGSTNFYYENPISAIRKIREEWGGEIKTRIEMDPATGKLGNRYIDLLARRGADTGKRFEWDKDIVSIRRRIYGRIKTALTGRGKGLETEAGGYTRRITIADVEWNKANGDPLDKPLGEIRLEDPDALALYGKADGNGGLQHRAGFIEFDDIEDPAELIEATYQALQEVNHPKTTYDMSVVEYRNRTGYEHEESRLGDTTAVIDNDLNVIIENRIIEKVQYLDDDKKGDVKLGNFITLFTDQAKEEQDFRNDIGGRKGVWDQPPKLDDTSFPDNVPPMPANAEAGGGFKIISVKWDYDPASYIGAYELYASEIQGFTPDTSNLIFKGRAGGYAHDVGTDQQWYYKVRAVNTHGTPGPFTAELTASTAKINSSEMMFGSVTRDILADLAVDASKLAEGSVTESKLMDDAVSAAKIAAQAVQNTHLANGAVNNSKLADLAVDAAKLADSAVTAQKIANLAVGTAAIQDLAVTNQKVQRLSADKITIGAATDFDPNYDPTTKETPAGAQAKVDAVDVGGRNYFVISDALENTAFTWATGIEYGETGALGSGFIPCSPGEEFICNYGNDQTLYYNAAEEYIGSYVGSIGIVPDENSTYHNVPSAPPSDRIPAFVRISFRNNFLDGRTKEEVKVMLEKGNKSTDWTPAPEDVSADAQTKADTAEQNAKDYRDLWAYPGTTFIDGGDIYTNSVTANKMATGTITANSGVIANAAITAAMIAELAVGTAAIQNLAVTNAKLGLLSVSTANIQDLAVTSAKIQSLTADKVIAASLSAISANLGTITAGDIYGVHIEGSEFVSVYDPGDSTEGSMVLQDKDLTFQQGFTNGSYESPFYESYLITTKYDVNGYSYYKDLKGIGSREYSVGPHGIAWSGSGGGVTEGLLGNFEIYINPDGSGTDFTTGAGENIELRPGQNLLLAPGGYNYFYSPTYIEGNGASLTMRSSDTSYSYINFYQGALRKGYVGPVSTSNNDFYINATAGLLRLYAADYVWTNGSLSVSGNLTVNGKMTSDLVFDGTVFPVTNALDHNGAGDHMYIRPQSAGEVRATAKGTTSTYVPMQASDFQTASLEKYKQDIQAVQDSSLQMIVSAEIKRYRLIAEVEAGIDQIRHGLVIGEGYKTPSSVIGRNGENISQYEMNARSWDAIKEQYLLFKNQDSTIKQQASTIINLQERIQTLETRLDQIA